MGDPPVAEEDVLRLIAPLALEAVQWYPGHMAKASREIKERLKLVNSVIEVVDARLPASSRHPELHALAGRRAHFLALTKTDLAEPTATRRWLRFYAQAGLQAFAVDAARGRGVAQLIAAVRRARVPARVMVLGAPNVGKSSLINRACGRGSARVGALPGLTRGPQWLKAGPDVEFLDTPGMLWPKITSLLQGLKLAWAGSIGENAYNAEAVGAALAVWLAVFRPQLLLDRYGVQADAAEPNAHQLLTDIGRRRGCLVAGGAVNMEQAARVLLQDARAGRLGRLTFDLPPEEGEQE